MKKKKAYGKVEGGKILWHDVVELGKAVSYFEGKEIEVTFEKQTFVRTLPQNAYFHAAHLPLIHDALIELGWDNWTIQQTKDYLKDMFLRTEIIDKQGRGTGKFITRHTSELNRQEFSEFLENCSLFAWHDLKVTIPPASVYKINLEAESYKMRRAA